jgi:nicotinamidase-related amidase
VHRGFLRDVLNSTTDPIRPYTGLGSDLGGTKGRCLFAGSWNAAIYPPLAAHSLPFDIYCSKNRMSGIWNEEQPLYKALKGHGIETLLFGGVNTDQCVLGTFVDAYNKGWNCVLVDDCCGTTTVGGRETTVWNAARSYGFVVNSGGLKEAAGRAEHD